MADVQRVAAIQRLACTVARKVYESLGWGWREEVYREAMAQELCALGVDARCEVALPVIYKGRPLSHVSVRMDMLLDGAVVIELKAVARLSARAGRQCRRYIDNCAGVRAGVAINFPDAPKREIEVALQTGSRS